MLLRLGAQRLAQELLEQEVTDFLGRARYQRVKAGQERRGYRNGYRPAHIRSAEGEIEVEVPRVRQFRKPHTPRPMVFLRGNSDVLERLVVEDSPVESGDVCPRSFHSGHRGRSV